MFIFFKYFFSFFANYNVLSRITSKLLLLLSFILFIFFHSIVSIRQIIKNYIFKCNSLVNTTLIICRPIMYYVVYILLHIVCVYYMYVYLSVYVHVYLCVYVLLLFLCFCFIVDFYMLINHLLKKKLFSNIISLSIYFGLFCSFRR